MAFGITEVYCTVNHALTAQSFLHMGRSDIMVFIDLFIQQLICKQSLEFCMITDLPFVFMFSQYEIFVNTNSQCLLQLFSEMT